MPELPEVETIKNTLMPLIIGECIKSVEILYPNIIDGDANEFKEKLKSSKFVQMDRIGKYLIFILNDNAFISHLRMEGKYYVVNKNEPYSPHCHVIFHLESGKDLRYCDTRKFGRMSLTDPTQYPFLEPFCSLAKEPYIIEPDKLYQKFQKSTRPIKDVLLDQHIILGIGNIYANEICFQMKINPLTPVKNLSYKRVKELVQVSIDILNKAIEQGGTTIHTFSSNGIDGRFQVHLNVHGKINQPCNKCGKTIKKIQLHGRGTYYCPHCQRKKS